MHLIRRFAKCLAKPVVTDQLVGKGSGYVLTWRDEIPTLHSCPKIIGDKIDASAPKDALNIARRIEHGN